MKYRAFGDFRKGYGHVKNGSGVEDYGSAYNDPEGRFFIGVICDGHSDKNCFRSAKGAQYGCESAIEILTRFFELYLSQKDDTRLLPDGFENRLKKSLKLCWDKKVYADIKDNPVTEDELSPLTERVRKIYESGNGLLNIYGATFLAVGICEDFFISFHIGDGIVLCIDEDGSYYSPVPQDPKGETGSPASLCDSDLFSRENAFRCGVSKKIPQIATVSSDGIEDSLDSFEYKKVIGSLFKKIASEEKELQQDHRLNEQQSRYFGSFLEYYADKGHGAEDDCSLAAIYDLSRPVPEVRMSSQEASMLWEQAMRERNDVVSDYENRKKNLLDSMSQQRCMEAFKGGYPVKYVQWMEAREKYENQKQTLKTIVTNEMDKVGFYENQLRMYEQYIDGFSDDSAKLKRVAVQNVDAVFMEPDEAFIEFRNAWQVFLKKKDCYKQLEADMEEAKSAVSDANNAIKKLTKLGSINPDGTDALINIANQKHSSIKDKLERAQIEYEEAKKDFERLRDAYFKDKKKSAKDSSLQAKDAHRQTNPDPADSPKDKTDNPQDVQVASAVDQAGTDPKDNSKDNDPDCPKAKKGKEPKSSDTNQKTTKFPISIDILRFK